MIWLWSRTTSIPTIFLPQLTILTSVWLPGIARIYIFWVLWYVHAFVFYYHLDLFLCLIQGNIIGPFQNPSLRSVVVQIYKKIKKEQRTFLVADSDCMGDDNDMIPRYIFPYVGFLVSSSNLFVFESSKHHCNRSLSSFRSVMRPRMQTSAAPTIPTFWSGCIWKLKNVRMTTGFAWVGLFWSSSTSMSLNWVASETSFLLAFVPIRYLLLLPTWTQSRSLPFALMS